MSTEPPLSSQTQFRRQFEVELLQSEARFHQLVDAVQDYAIYMLDPQGLVTSWNTGAARIKGYRAEEIIGRHYSQFYTPAEREAGKPMAGLTLAREHGHFEGEGWRVRKDGTRFWANVTITPVYAPTGELLGYAKVTRDLTERVRMENELRDSREQLRELSHYLERTREKERAELAREIHDEVGGMLTGLKLDLARLKQHVDLEGRQKLVDYGKAIDTAVQTVRQVATQLRPAVLDDFGLLVALEWQLGEFERRSGIAGHWRSATTELSLPDDAAIAVFRVLQESCETNVARHAQATQVHVTCDLADHRLHLTIADNGVGITPGQLSGSRSLGLVGMRERLRQHSGTVTITGQAGVGTTVQVMLPLSAVTN